MPVFATSANITDIQANWRESDVRVRWTSTDPAGTYFQVYLDGRLAWSGTARSCRLPAPDARRSRVGVLAVPTAERTTDHSASLPAAEDDRARLWWYGGLYLGAVTRYAVYMGLVAGGAVSYAAPVEIIPAYPQGIPVDGAGIGPAGAGGAGSSASAYTWTSPPLANGTWNFAVVSYDAAGNPGTATTFAVAISAAPQAPPPDSQGRRLVGAYNPSTQTLVLTWQASLP